MEIDKNSGMWMIACSYASDEAKKLGLRMGGLPRYRYVTERAPQIYFSLLDKTYSFEEAVKRAQK